MNSSSTFTAYLETSKQYLLIIPTFYLILVLLLGSKQILIFNFTYYKKTFSPIYLILIQTLHSKGAKSDVGFDKFSIFLIFFVFTFCDLSDGLLLPHAYQEELIMR